MYNSKFRNLSKSHATHPLLYLDHKNWFLGKKKNKKVVKIASIESTLGFTKISCTLKNWSEKKRKPSEKTYVVERKKLR